MIDTLASYDDANNWLSHDNLQGTPGASITAGDFDGNGTLELADVDQLTTELAAGSQNIDFDVDGDQLVSHNDLRHWIEVLKGTVIGDADLSGASDAVDFSVWNNERFTFSSAWSDGDFNADGRVDFRDFNLWNANKFLTAGLAGNSFTIPLSSSRELLDRRQPRAALTNQPTHHDAADIDALFAIAASIPADPRHEITSGQSEPAHDNDTDEETSEELIVPGISHTRRRADWLDRLGDRRHDCRSEITDVAFEAIAHEEDLAGKWKNWLFPR